MDLTGERHVVSIGYPSRDVLHLAHCRCGWTVGYDRATHAAAVDRAYDHCADEKARELMDRHGLLDDQETGP